MQKTTDTMMLAAHALCDLSSDEDAHFDSKRNLDEDVVSQRQTRKKSRRGNDVDEEWIKKPQNKRHIKHIDSRRSWKPDEDALLMKIVKEYQEANEEPHWVRISAYFYRRTVRSCRNRWEQHVSPRINTLPFTQEEDDAIVDFMRTNPSSWSACATFLNTGRTTDMIKNRYGLMQRKDNYKKSPINVEALKKVQSPIIPTSWQKGSIPLAHVETMMDQVKAIAENSLDKMPVASFVLCCLECDDIDSLESFANQRGADIARPLVAHTLAPTSFANKKAIVDAFFTRRTE